MGIVGTVDSAYKAMDAVDPAMDGAVMLARRYKLRSIRACRWRLARSSRAQARA